MEIKLSDHFTYKKIGRFVLSPILMMIFTSLYGVVDGFCISNFAGNDAYAGVNVIMPYIYIIGGIGFIFGTGGSALTGMYLGRKEQENADKSFTTIIKGLTVVGLVFCILGYFLVEPIANFLGSLTQGTTQGMVNEAIAYGKVLTLGQIFFMLQCTFQNYLIVDEKPKFAFISTIFAGITNVILDILFIKVFNWGVIGAASATIIGCIVGTIIPLLHFIYAKNKIIHFIKCKIDFSMIGKALFNGLSEFVSNISSSVMAFVYNIKLLVYYGQEGVSAYGTLMYISFIFVSILIGYCIGISPIISYNYGADNKKELRSLLSKSLIITTITGLLMVIASELLGPLFSKAFLKGDPNTMSITIEAFKVFSIHFIFAGFCIYISSFFTALNNGLISAIISLARILILQVGCVLLLPDIFGKEILWACSTISDCLSFILAFILLFANSNKYGYFIKNKN